MTRTGTHCYVDAAHARAAYGAEFDAAIKEGRIAVGMPVVRPGELVKADYEGRYFVITPDYPEYTTWRTECGRGRVSYHVEWDTSYPFVCYWDGTATRHVRTLGHAFAYFRATRGALLKEQPTC
jgi:hypothetical protein